MTEPCGMADLPADSSFPADSSTGSTRGTAGPPVSSSALAVNGKIGIRVSCMEVVMYVEIDFNSDEAIYQQLRDQIILGIATSTLTEGQVLPSVRQLADDIGINMHTVNKTYTLLKQEGFIKVDRRRGCVVAVDADELRAKADCEQDLRVILAEAICRGVPRSDVHDMIDRIYAEYGAVDEPEKPDGGNPEENGPSIGGKQRSNQEARAFDPRESGDGLPQQ